MAHAVRHLTLANVDLDDREQMAEVLQQDLALAETRIQDAVRQMREKGLIDAQGRRINSDLPPDMREGSPTEFGG